MIALALGTFFASFTLFTGGVPGLVAALAGVAVIVYALVNKRSPWPVRVAVGLVGAAMFVMLPGIVTKSGMSFRTVGVGFFPEDDKAEFTIAIETPPGSNLEYTRLKAMEAARITRAHKEVEYTYTTLCGGASGTVDEGAIYVRLVPKNKRRVSAEQFAQVLRDEMKNVAGVTLSVFTNDFGGGRKQLQYQLRGNDLASLNLVADTILKIVKSTPGAEDVGLSTKGQKPELDIDLHRGIAATMGVTVGQLAQSLRPAFAGIHAGDWQDPTGQMRDVQVRLTPEARRNAENLRQLPLVVTGPNGTSTTVPLGQVADIRQDVGPAIIDHLDRDLVVTVEANPGGRATGDITNDVMAKVGKLTLPPGVKFSLGGDAQQQQEVFGQIFFALGVAVMLMYLILVAQFGSFLDPLAILMSLPLSLIGVLLALALTGYTINIMSLIGVILLMGIVAKNAILLIDFAKWAREKEGLPLREALIEAGAIRLRPILMTTFALIAGMIPVALGRGEGAQFRAPLGVAIIGGVLTSTLLTLLVIPTFYEVMDEGRHWLAKRFGFSPPMTAEHPVPGAHSR